MGSVGEGLAMNDGRVSMEQSAARGTTDLGRQTTDQQVQDAPTTNKGLEFPRFFPLPGSDPFEEVTWDLRSAVIGNERGEVVFEQRDVEIPSFWSQQATNIVV